MNEQFYFPEGNMTTFSTHDRFNTLQMGVVSSKRIFDLLDRDETMEVSLIKF